MSDHESEDDTLPPSLSNDIQRLICSPAFDLLKSQSFLPLSDSSPDKHGQLRLLRNQIHAVLNESAATPPDASEGNNVNSNADQFMATLDIELPEKASNSKPLSVAPTPEASASFSLEHHFFKLCLTMVLSAVQRALQDTESLDYTSTLSACNEMLSLLEALPFGAVCKKYRTDEQFAMMVARSVEGLTQMIARASLNARAHQVVFDVCLLTAVHSGDLGLVAELLAVALQKPDDDWSRHSKCIRQLISDADTHFEADGLFPESMRAIDFALDFFAFSGRFTDSTRPSMYMTMGSLSGLAPDPGAMLASQSVALSDLKPRKIAIGESVIYVIDCDHHLWSAGPSSLTTSTTSFSLVETVKDIKFCDIASYKHSLACTIDGTIYAWGSGSHGCLGLGSSDDVFDPTPMQSTIKFVKVAVGSSYSAGVANDGSLYTWGSASYGRLGHGDREDRMKPKKVSQISNVSTVSCGRGDAHTVVLTHAGEVYTFGDSDYGKLGHSHDNDVPHRIGASYKFVQAYAGSQYTIALDSDGNVHACGSGSDGCVAASEHRRTLSKIRGIEGRVTSILAGNVTVFASTESGAIYTWGRVVGNGSARNLEPQLLSTLPPQTVAIACNSECAVLVAEQSIASRLPLTAWPAWKSSLPLWVLASTLAVQLRDSGSDSSEDAKLLKTRAQQEQLFNTVVRQLTSAVILMQDVPQDLSLSSSEDVAPQSLAELWYNRGNSKDATVEAHRAAVSRLVSELVARQQKLEQQQDFSKSLENCNTLLMLASKLNMDASITEKSIKVLEQCMRSGDASVVNKTLHLLQQHTQTLYPTLALHMQQAKEQLAALMTTTRFSNSHFQQLRIIFSGIANATDELPELFKTEGELEDFSAGFLRLVFKSMQHMKTDEDAFLCLWPAEESTSFLESDSKPSPPSLLTCEQCLCLIQDQVVYRQDRQKVFCCACKGDAQVLRKGRILRAPPTEDEFSMLAAENEDFKDLDGDMFRNKPCVVPPEIEESFSLKFLVAGFQPQSAVVTTHGSNEELVQQAASNFNDMKCKTAIVSFLEWLFSRLLSCKQHDTAMELWLSLIRQFLNLQAKSDGVYNELLSDLLSDLFSKLSHVGRTLFLESKQQHSKYDTSTYDICKLLTSSRIKLRDFLKRLRPTLLFSNNASTDTLLQSVSLSLADVKLDSPFTLRGPKESVLLHIDADLSCDNAKLVLECNIACHNDGGSSLCHAPMRLLFDSERSSTVDVTIPLVSDRCVTFTLWNRSEEHDDHQSNSFFLGLHWTGSSASSCMELKDTTGVEKDLTSFPDPSSFLTIVAVPDTSSDTLRLWSLSADSQPKDLEECVGRAGAFDILHFDVRPCRQNSVASCSHMLHGMMRLQAMLTTWSMAWTEPCKSWSWLGKHLVALPKEDKQPRLSDQLAQWTSDNQAQFPLADQFLTSIMQLASRRRLWTQARSSHGFVFVARFCAIAVRWFGVEDMVTRILEEATVATNMEQFESSLRDTIVTARAFQVQMIARNGSDEDKLKSIDLRCAYILDRFHFDQSSFMLQDSADSFDNKSSPSLLKRELVRDPAPAVPDATDPPTQEGLQITRTVTIYPAARPRPRKARKASLGNKKVLKRSLTAPSGPVDEELWKMTLGTKARTHIKSLVKPTGKRQMLLEALCAILGDSSKDEEFSRDMTNQLKIGERVSLGLKALLRLLSSCLASNDYSELAVGSSTIMELSSVRSFPASTDSHDIVEVLSVCCDILKALKDSSVAQNITGAALLQLNTHMWTITSRLAVMAPDPVLMSTLNSLCELASNIYCENNAETLLFCRTVSETLVFLVCDLLCRFPTSSVELFRSTLEASTNVLLQWALPDTQASLMIALLAAMRETSQLASVLQEALTPHWETLVIQQHPTLSTLTVRLMSVLANAFPDPWTRRLIDVLTMPETARSTQLSGEIASNLAKLATSNEDIFEEVDAHVVNLLEQASMPASPAQPQSLHSSSHKLCVSGRVEYSGVCVNTRACTNSVVLPIKLMVEALPLGHVKAGLHKQHQSDSEESTPIMMHGFQNNKTVVLFEKLSTKPTILDFDDTGTVTGIVTINESDYLLRLSPNQTPLSTHSKLRLHSSIHGENLLVKDSSAQRGSPDAEFADAVAFSETPLSRSNEQRGFSVRIKTDDSLPWNTGVQIGVILENPAGLSSLPKSADSLQSSFIWDGSSLLHDGTIIHQNYATLPAGTSLIHLSLTDAGELSFSVDGQSLGVAAHDVAVGSEVWAVVDVYGSCVQVELLGELSADDREGDSSSVNDQSTIVSNLVLTADSELLAVKLKQSCFLSNAQHAENVSSHIQSSPCMKAAQCMLLLAPGTYQALCGSETACFLAPGFVLQTGGQMKQDSCAAASAQLERHHIALSFDLKKHVFAMFLSLKRQNQALPDSEHLILLARLSLVMPLVIETLHTEEAFRQLVGADNFDVLLPSLAEDALALGRLRSRYCSPFLGEQIERILQDLDDDGKRLVEKLRRIGVPEHMFSVLQVPSEVKVSDFEAFVASNVLPFWKDEDAQCTLCKATIHGPVYRNTPQRVLVSQSTLCVVCFKSCTLGENFSHGTLEISNMNRRCFRVDDAVCSFSQPIIKGCIVKLFPDASVLVLWEDGSEQHVHSPHESIRLDQDTQDLNVIAHHLCLENGTSEEHFLVPESELAATPADDQISGRVPGYYHALTVHLGVQPRSVILKRISVRGKHVDDLSNVLSNVEVVDDVFFLPKDTSAPAKSISLMPMLWQEIDSVQQLSWKNDHAIICFSIKANVIVDDIILTFGGALSGSFRVTGGFSANLGNTLLLQTTSQCFLDSGMYHVYHRQAMPMADCGSDSSASAASVDTMSMVTNPQHLAFTRAHYSSLADDIKRVHSRTTVNVVLHHAAAAVLLRMSRTLLCKLLHVTRVHIPYQPASLRYPEIRGDTSRLSLILRMLRLGIAGRFDQLQCQRLIEIMSGHVAEHGTGELLSAASEWCAASCQRLNANSLPNTISWSQEDSMTSPNSWSGTCVLDGAAAIMLSFNPRCKLPEGATLTISNKHGDTTKYKSGDDLAPVSFSGDCVQWCIQTPVRTNSSSSSTGWLRLHLIHMHSASANLLLDDHLLVQTDRCASLSLVTCCLQALVPHLSTMQLQQQLSFANTAASMASIISKGQLSRILSLRFLGQALKALLPNINRNLDRPLNMCLEQRYYQQNLALPSSGYAECFVGDQTFVAVQVLGVESLAQDTIRVLKLSAGTSSVVSSRDLFKIGSASLVSFSLVDGKERSFSWDSHPFKAADAIKFLDFAQKGSASLERTEVVDSPESVPATEGKHEPEEPQEVAPSSPGAGHDEDAKVSSHVLLNASQIVLHAARLWWSGALVYMSPEPVPYSPTLSHMLTRDEDIVDEDDSAAEDVHDNDSAAHDGSQHAACESSAQPALPSHTPMPLACLEGFPELETLLTSLADIISMNHAHVHGSSFTDHLQDIAFIVGIHSMRRMERAGAPPLFCKRASFTDEDAYGQYVKATLKPNMKVRMLVDFESVREDDIGTYLTTNSSQPPAKFQWEQAGITYWVHWHQVELLEDNEHAARPKDTRFEIPAVKLALAGAHVDEGDTPLSGQQLESIFGHVFARDLFASVTCGGNSLLLRLARTRRGITAIKSLVFCMCKKDGVMLFEPTDGATTLMLEAARVDNVSAFLLLREHWRMEPSADVVSMAITSNSLAVLSTMAITTAACEHNELLPVVLARRSAPHVDSMLDVAGFDRYSKSKIYHDVILYLLNKTKNLPEVVLNALEDLSFESCHRQVYVPPLTANVTHGFQTRDDAAVIRTATEDPNLVSLKVDSIKTYDIIVLTIGASEAPLPSVVPADCPFVRVACQAMTCATWPEMTAEQWQKLGSSDALLIVTPHKPEGESLATLKQIVQSTPCVFLGAVQESDMLFESNEVPCVLDMLPPIDVPEQCSPCSESYSQTQSGFFCMWPGGSTVLTALFPLQRLCFLNVDSTLSADHVLVVAALRAVLGLQYTLLSQEEALHVANKDNKVPISFLFDQHEHSVALVEYNSAYPQMQQHSSGWQCDICDCGGNSAVRYRCTEGCDFDICASCFETTPAVPIHLPGSKDSSFKQPGVEHLARFDPLDVSCRWQVLRWLAKNIVVEDMSLLLHLCHGNQKQLEQIVSVISFEDKEKLLKSKIRSTTTHKSSPTIRLNRMINRNELTVHGFGSAIDRASIEKTVYAQASRQLLAQPSSLWRLSGRYWTVKFHQEGVTDAGGAYSESISEMLHELETGLVPLLVPTANHKNTHGNNQDMFVLRPLSERRDLELFKLLGILIGTAIRSGEPIDLPLAPPMWKCILGHSLSMADMAEIDLFFCQLPELKFKDENELAAMELDPSVLGADGKPVIILPGEPYITAANVNTYVDKVVDYKLHEFDAAAAVIRENMDRVLDRSMLQLFTPKELSVLVCGSNRIDIALLKSVTSYNNISSSHRIVGWFWEVLESLDAEEQSLFVRFTWGRTRLPRTKADFKGQRFQLNVSDANTNALPKSYTCFFQLKLPRYRTKEILEDKLKYAITHCSAIDADFNVHDEDDSNEDFDDDEDYDDDEEEEESDGDEEFFDDDDEEIFDSSDQDEDMYLEYDDEEQSYESEESTDSNSVF